MTSLKTENLSFEEKQLYIPELEEIKNVLSSGLTTNFKNVEVEVVECPNLEKSPYHISSTGLCGSPLLMECGGPPYLLPLVDRTKIYDLKEIGQRIYGNDKEFLAVGAGAGPWPLVNTNCEGMLNLKVRKDGTTKSGSYLARVDADKKCVLEKIPDNETKFALLGNIFMSEGKPGKVLRVICKQRIGSDDFISSIRKTLTDKYEDKIVGLGGIFLLKNGKAKQHIMQDFSKVPIHTDEDLNKWLTFHEMNSTLIAVGTLVTGEADLDLRLQHFHSFSTHGEGGHYHYDTTPDTVEYEGYFSIGEKVIRIDKPVQTHKMGRD